MVFKKGELYYNDGKLKDFPAPAIEEYLDERAHDTFHVRHLTKSDFEDVRQRGVIGMIPGEIVSTDNGYADHVDLQKDILKIAVVERHKNTGHIGLGYIQGYGLKSGAVATSISHDSHNIIVVGTNAEDMAFAANYIVENHGGIVVVDGGKVLASVVLEIAGIMSDEPLTKMNEELEAAKDAGIDMLLTANNHCSDTTTEGVLRTVKRVREMGLTPLGTQLSDEEPKYAVVDVGGIKVGMAAYTYATSEVNGRPSLNYEPEVAQVGLVNYFVETNLDAFYSEVQSLLSQMQEDGAEATMLCIHWGTEYSLQADSSQRMIAQKMCDMGVDVIVGGHPHVVEPMELLTSSSDSRHKTAVIYSLGNAVSNQRRDLMTLNTGHTEDGAVFTVTFEKYADGGVYVADVNVMPTWVNLHSVDEKQEYNIVPLEDARRTEWQNLYGLDAAALANAVASYDRTMNIVGPGLEQCRSYYAQEKQARETPVVPTEEAA